MPQIQINQAYRVDIIESERGWGRKIDETLYFDNEEEEAKKYVCLNGEKLMTRRETTIKVGNHVPKSI